MSLATAITTDQFAAEWQQWHNDFESFRRQTGGYLTITGIIWLTADPQPVVGIPGLWSGDEAGARVHLAEGELLTVGGEQVTGDHHFGALPPHTSVTAEHSGEIIEISRRGDQYIVRPRQSDHPFLLAYEGTPAYAPDARWRCEARFLPWDEARPVALDAVIEGLRDQLIGVGELEFTVSGELVRLVALRNPVRSRGGFVVLFRDATSGVTTYPANRSVEVAEPNAEGVTVIDFNRAHNLPCAYSDFTTCPLPPAQNRLTIAIEVGEKSPHARITADWTP